jgi:hypothetical protein
MNGAVSIRFPGSRDGAISRDRAINKDEVLPPFSVRGGTVVETDSDEALLSAVCQGNAEALGLLFRRYSATVRRIALRILQNASEAEDLLQDVFVLIHRFSGTFDDSKATVQLPL